MEWRRLMTSGRAIGWSAGPVGNRERARTFYGTQFDITMPDLEMPGGGFAVFPHMGTGICGPLDPRTGFKPAADSGVGIWLGAGDDLQVAPSRREAAGGVILRPDG